MRTTGIMIIVAGGMLRFAKEGDWTFAYVMFGVLVFFALLDMIWGPRYSFEK